MAQSERVAREAIWTVYWATCVCMGICEEDEQAGVEGVKRQRRGDGEIWHRQPLDVPLTLPLTLFLLPSHSDFSLPPTLSLPTYQTDSLPIWLGRATKCNLTQLVPPPPPFPPPERLTLSGQPRRKSINGKSHIYPAAALTPIPHGWLTYSGGAMGEGRGSNPFSTTNTHWEMLEKKGGKTHESNLVACIVLVVPVSVCR